MDIATALEGISKKREEIHKKSMWDDPNSLSDLMVKLSVYNAYLADNIAKLHKEATDKQGESYLNHKSKTSASEAKELARFDSTEEREEFEKVEFIYKSTSNLITVLQSRLRVIENQRRQEGVNQT